MGPFSIRISFCYFFACVLILTESVLLFICYLIFIAMEQRTIWNSFYATRINYVWIWKDCNLNDCLVFVNYLGIDNLSRDRTFGEFSY